MGSAKSDAQDSRLLTASDSPLSSRRQEQHTCCKCCKCCNPLLLCLFGCCKKVRSCCVNMKPPFLNEDSDSGQDGEYVLDTTGYIQYQQSQALKDGKDPSYKLPDIEATSDFTIVLTDFAKGSSCKMNLVKHRPSRLCAALKVYKYVDMQYVVERNKNRRKFGSVFEHKDQHQSQFKAELDIAPLTLQSPFLANVLGGFVYRDHSCILMEFAPFGALSGLVSLRKGLGPSTARFYALEMAKALSFLHERELIHRDMCLNNILLRYTGHVVLSDFGLVVSEKTSPAATCGSHVSRPPEVWAVQTQSYAVDVWMFGISLWNLITNKFPFFCASVAKQKTAVHEAKLNFTEEFNEQSRNLLTRTIVADPYRRLSIDDVIEHVYLASLAEPSRPPFSPEELLKIFEKKWMSEKTTKMAIVRFLINRTPLPQSDHSLRNFLSRESTLTVGKAASKISSRKLQSPSKEYQSSSLSEFEAN